jgi:DNA-binding transcriptional regulator YiaG
LAANMKQSSVLTRPVRAIVPYMTMRPETAQDRALAVANGRHLASSGAGRMIRVAAGLPVRAVAEAVGVDYAAVWHWEAGSKRPSEENAIRYAEFLEELRAVNEGARPRGRRKRAAA